MDTPLSSDLGSGWHCQMAGRLANCSWLDVLLTDWPSNKMLTWPSSQDLTLGQVDTLSDGLLSGWLVGWSSDKIPLVYWCKRWTSTRSDLGLGWHSVKWLVSWSIADDWLADWSPNKLSTIFWMKGLCEVRANCHSVLKNQMTFLHLGRWTPFQIWYTFRLTLCQMIGWLANCSWLAGWLDIWQNVTCVLM